MTGGIGYGRIDAGLCVTVLTGRPDEAAIAVLLRLYRTEHAMARHHSLFDAQALTGVDSDAFEALTRHVNDNRDVLAGVLDRQAIVQPSGLPGAVVHGYRSVFDFPYAANVFADRAAALAWLGRDDARAAVDEVATALAQDPIVKRVEALIAADPAMTLDEAARRLHLSARSLQRRLEEAGTSFRAAVRSEQIAEAKRLLGETDRKLTAIAAGLGFRSLQSFSASFRRATGETPSTWRARHGQRRS